MENSMAAPVAWTTRNIIRIGRSGARPQASDPMVKTINPRINIRPLPTYSETLPNIRSRLVSVTRYAVTTHWEYVTSTPKYVVIVGNAMFTTLPSRTAINIAAKTINAMNRGFLVFPEG
jgi:hypothetical protein